MIIKYFKTKMWGDCYVKNDDYMNIVSISKDNLCLIADDERIFTGAYKEIKIKKGYFKKIRRFAIKNKRKELTDILKKIHEKNKEILNFSKDPFVKIKRINTNLEKSTSLRNYFFNTEPILK